MALCLAEAGLDARRPRRGRLLLRPRPRLPARRRHHRGGVGGAAHALRPARAAVPARPRCPAWTRDRVRWVPHHVAHAASATFASGFDPCSVLVLDGRGERASHLAGRSAGGDLEVLAAQALPHSLGLLYEELTAHLGFRRSSDEYKVMAMASYGTPDHLDAFRALVRADGDGGFTVGDVDFAALRAAARAGRRLHARPRRARGDRAAAPGGGAARPRHLAARAHGRPRPGHGGRRRAQLRGQLARSGATARSSASGCSRPPATRAPRSAPRCTSRAQLGDRPGPMPTAALGRGWDDAALAARLETAEVAFERPDGHRRRGGRGARRQPGRGLVPGPVGVRAARARAPLAARRPARRREPGEAQRHQGPRAVPAGRADGARRARRRHLRQRPGARARSCSSRTA